MKKSFFILLLCLASLAGSRAQTPQAMKYQAVVRSSTGSVLINQAIQMRISLLADSASGTVVYCESHDPTTNAFGLVNLDIGKGTVLSGTFSSINWATGTYFVKIEVDETGSGTFTWLGTSQLLSVPYALYAASSGTAVEDHDTSATNELQSLSIDGNDLSISNGNTVTLPSYTDTTWLKNGNNVYYNQGKVGIGTSNPSHTLDVNGTLHVSNIPEDAVYDSVLTIDNGQIKKHAATLLNVAGGWTDDGSAVRLTTPTDNVGIGTTTPSAKVDINNTNLPTTVSSRVDWLSMFGSSGSADKLYFSHIRHTAGNTWHSAEIRLQKRVDNTDMQYISFKGSTIEPRIEFGVANTPTMTFTEQGRLGIGTTDPTAQLHMNCGTLGNTTGNFKYNFITYCASPNVDQLLVYHSRFTNPSGVPFPWMSAETRIQKRVDNVDLGYMSFKSRWLEWGNGATPLMTLSEVGYLGIGTTAPVAVLHIVAAGNHLKFERPGISPTWGIGISSNGALGFEDNTGERMRLTANNRLGLGNTNPQATIDAYCGSLGSTTGNTVMWQRLNGSSSNNEILDIFQKRHTNGSDWNTSEIRIQKRVDAIDFHYISFKGETNPSLVFGYGSNTQLMTLKDNGYLGLGTSTPSTLLDVAGNGKFTGTVIGANAVNNNEFVTKQQLTAVAPIHNIGESYGGGIVFYVYDNGQHGLIAAAQDMTDHCWYWSIEEPVVRTWANADGIYGGKMNSIKIALTTPPINSSSAARSILFYFSPEPDRLTDWYLPCRYELNLLYLQKDVVGGFSSVNYWSSNEGSAYTGYCINFGNGDVYDHLKEYEFAIRPIRSF